MPDGPSVFSASAAKFLVLSGDRGSMTPPPIATPAPSFGCDGHVTRWSETPLLSDCGSRVTLSTTCWVAPPRRVLSVLSPAFWAIAGPPPAAPRAVRLRARTRDKGLLVL